MPPDLITLKVVLNSLLIALLGALIIFGLRRIKRRLRRKMQKQVPVLRFLSELGITLSQAGVIITSLLLISEQDPRVQKIRSLIVVSVAKAFTMPLLTIEGQPYSLTDIGRLIILGIGLWLIVKALTKLVRGRLLKVVGINKELEDIIALIMQVMLMGVGLLVLLQAVGINISSIAILLSVVGVGIGLGFQNITNNVISGIIILFERPIQAGDYVNVGDLTGIVLRTGIRITEIETLDKIAILVPNSELIEKLVVNWSHGSPVSRLHLPFGVAYGSSIEDVRAAALAAADYHPKVLRYPKPEVWFEGFGDSSLLFDLLVWIREPWNQPRIKSDLYYLLEASFRHYEVTVPFPQRVLHISSADLGSVISHSKDAPVAKPIASERPERNTSAPDFATISQWCSIVDERNPLTEEDILELVERMRSTGGVELKDRKYGISKFRHCFVGSEAVDWIVNHQDAAREEAVEMGKELIRRGFIRHVTDDHDFEDKYFFYVFRQDRA